MGPTLPENSSWPPCPLPLAVAPDEATFAFRSWEESDAEQLAAAWADDEVQRWTNPPPATLVGARRWIAGCPTRRADGRALDLVVDVGGEVAGELGLSSFDGRRRAALVGYWVTEAHRGAGLASRALHAAAEWFHAEMRGHSLLAQCDSANVASQRAAQRAGFVELGVRDGQVVYVSRSVQVAGQ